MVVTTERLILRRWRPSDREPFARLNADPRVMEFMPSVLSRNESDALIDRIEADFDLHAFGVCAVERRGEASLLGFVGLNVSRFEAAFTPCVEIAWRLAADYWGHGFATEGARDGALRLRNTATRRAGLVRCSGQPTIPTSDGKDWNDARPGGGF
jgi:RimJ/RimL family protein N-acetyltransferase